MAIVCTALKLALMGEATVILNAIAAGEPQAMGQLLPVVYDELRKLAANWLANEKPGQTLDATGLVHEAYLRLVGAADESRWQNRGHFFAAAAEAMRRILIEKARRKARVKHGGDRTRVTLDYVEGGNDGLPEYLLDLDGALQRLTAENAEIAEVVKLRYFAGLTLKQAAAVLGISLRTANRHWAYAKAWLYDALQSV